MLQPLIFLGGVFYSASLLPEPFETLTHFNPVYYMIALVRYGFLGYAEANVALSLLFLTLATAALFAFNLRLFSKGLQAAGLGQLLLRGGDGASGAVVCLRGVAFSPLRLAQAGSRFLGSLSCLTGAHLGILCAFLGPRDRLGCAGMLALRLSLRRPRRSEL